MQIAVYLDNEEARIFVELRRIAMKNGSVRLNYDKDGIVQSIDEFKHYELSDTLKLSTQILDKKNQSDIL